MVCSYKAQEKARRKKGKLYKVKILGNRRFTQTSDGVFEEVDVKTTAWKRPARAGAGFEVPVHIPEGSVVLYLHTMGKLDAKVLCGETIYRMPRADIDSEPISE